MGTEIERKFLVTSTAWLADAVGVRIWQGYLSTDPDRTVRVRLKGPRAFLTIKGRSVGSRRAEFEYEIPAADAQEMLGSLCQQPTIDKVRYTLPHQGYTWEIDVFAGANQGLVVAEVELADESEDPPRPPWIGREVTDDPRYYNARLIDHPYRDWAGT